MHATMIPSLSISYLFAPVVLSLAAAAQGTTPVEHVIHISVDGLSGSLLEELLAGDVVGDYANFQRFVDEGATTFQARTDFTRTNTLPNHVSMVTGRPVQRPRGQPDTVHHGWTDNDDPGSNETLHDDGNPNVDYIASSFDVVHDHGLSTGFFASKSKFVLFEQSYDAAAGAPDVTGVDDGKDKLDVYVEDSAIQADFLAQMAAQEFDYVFLHYRDPDGAGHDGGWGSAQWDDAVRLVDGWLGEVFALVEGSPGLAGSTVIFLSADHGGEGTSHSDADEVANYTIPFFAWGVGVTPGADLYDLNPTTRADPGTGRPDYNAPLQPIRNGDGGNLALALLGLPPIPGSTINVAQDLVLGTQPAVAEYGCDPQPTAILSVLAGAPVIGTTLFLGVDNPLGSQSAGSLSFVVIALAPDPAFPCGSVLPAFGELLVSLAPGDRLATRAGAPWAGPGLPAPVSIAIRNDIDLVGRSFFLQGLLFDPSASTGPRFGLANAFELRIGG